MVHDYVLKLLVLSLDQFLFFGIPLQSLFLSLIHSFPLSAESSADLRKQVLAARAIQAKRYAAPGYEGVHCNAQLNAGQNEE